jgi:hypothetical protein
MSLNVPLEAAQSALDEYVIKGATTMDVDGATGIPHYIFPEFTGHD